MFFATVWIVRIRRGKIRILIDDGSGNPVPVGPIQLSSADTIDELQGRVCLVNAGCDRWGTKRYSNTWSKALVNPLWYLRYSWLQQNEPKIAAGWPHGVVSGLPGGLVFVGAGWIRFSLGWSSVEKRCKRRVSSSKLNLGRFQWDHRMWMWLWFFLCGGREGWLDD